MSLLAKTFNQAPVVPFMLLISPTGLPSKTDSVKGAVCRLGEEIHTQNFDIYNINEGNNISF